MRFRFVVLLLATGAITLAQNRHENSRRRDDLKKPLVIAGQGSFFVGGESKTLAAGGEVTINQMYVQYQIPPDGERHVPVVMVHGCCLSRKTWETTPDGRMGWSDYFVRQDRPVYIPDQSSRGRSGFDATAINQARLGAAPSATIPRVFTFGREAAWKAFRLGPKY